VIFYFASFHTTFRIDAQHGRDSQFKIKDKKFHPNKGVTMTCLKKFHLKLLPILLLSLLGFVVSSSLLYLFALKVRWRTKFNFVLYPTPLSEENLFV